MANLIYDGHIIPLASDEVYRNAIFLWKRDRRQNWEDLLNTDPATLAGRVKSILEEEGEETSGGGRKIPKIADILKMDEFREWAKTNERYLDFVARVKKMRDDPTVGDDELKKLKAESEPLIRELAKEYKKVLAAA